MLRQVLTCLEKFGRIETSLNRFGHVQTCSDLFRRVQTCSDVFRRVQTSLSPWSWDSRAAAEPLTSNYPGNIHGRRGGNMTLSNLRNTKLK